MTLRQYDNDEPRMSVVALSFTAIIRLICVPIYMTGCGNLEIKLLVCWHTPPCTKQMSCKRMFMTDSYCVHVLLDGNFGRS